MTNEDRLKMAKERRETLERRRLVLERMEEELIEDIGENDELADDDENKCRTHDWAGEFTAICRESRELTAEIGIIDEYLARMENPIPSGWGGAGLGLASLDELTRGM
jgi:hypothetical protein